jgi:hypothetical protein
MNLAHILGRRLGKAPLLGLTPVVQYQGLTDTIVQLFISCGSGVIASSHPI